MYSCERKSLNQNITLAVHEPEPQESTWCKLNSSATKEYVNLKFNIKEKEER